MHQQMVHGGGAVHGLADVRDQAQPERVRRGAGVCRRRQREGDDVAGACPAKEVRSLLRQLNGDGLLRSANLHMTRYLGTVELELMRT
jgi:hypothetical protein